MQKTIVQLECVSKKEGYQYGYKGNPKEWEIELSVPTDQNSIFYKMSGGTNFTLRTINEGAAGMFTIGDSYMMEISPIAEYNKEHGINAGSGN